MNGAERDYVRRAIDEAQRAKLEREQKARDVGRCSRCGVSLTSENRAKNGKRRRAWCKPCDSKRRLRYYARKDAT